MSSLGHAKITWKDAKETLLDWRLYLHYLVFISISVPFSSISLFTPTIVTGLGYEGLKAQLFTVPPYAIAFLVTIVVAWQSEKRGMRAYGSCASLTIAGLAFLVQGTISFLLLSHGWHSLLTLKHMTMSGVLPSHAFKARYGLLCVSVAFSFAANPLLLSWLTANLRNTGAATLAVPLNVSIAQIGQIVGMCHLSNELSYTLTSDMCSQACISISLLRHLGIPLGTAQMPASLSKVLLLCSSHVTCM